MANVEAREWVSGEGERRSNALADRGSHPNHGCSRVDQVLVSNCRYCIAGLEEDYGLGCLVYMADPWSGLRKLASERERLESTTK